MRTQRAYFLALGLGWIAQPALSAPAITHGVASGDVTSDSAVIWSRSDREADMTVRYAALTGLSSNQEAHGRSLKQLDYTAQTMLTGLVPATSYRYNVSFADDSGRSSAIAGTFTTAPLPDQSIAVSLIWSGDLAGQRYCRRTGIGYNIFTPMKKFGADFFVANGDMIYADSACPARGIEPGWTNVPADFPGIGDRRVDWTNVDQVQEVYNAHWRYNREDEHYRAFLETTPQYVQWDDHEVINDFGANWDEYPPSGARPGYANIVAAGRKSLFDYNPISRHPSEPFRIYRSYRWGKHLELFILDARSYRTPNTTPDTRQHNKTMLGIEQLSWLTKGLVASDATWKIISSDVPLSLPTGSRADQFGRDAYASGSGGSSGSLAGTTGFESELLRLLRDLDGADVRNIVFLATDVHFASQLRYESDFDGDGDRLLFHEMVSGPLSAIRASAPPALDATLHPVVLYAEGGIFNFGTVRVAAETALLTADIRDELGVIRPGSELRLEPQQ